MKKLLSLILASVLCLSVLSGCGEKKEAVKYLDTFKTTMGSITNLNQYKLGGTAYFKFAANLLDGLVETDKYGRYVPSLASEWSSNDDLTVWTFKLRDGQYWVDHTGAKTQYQVTAKNFVDGIRWVADPANDAEGFTTIRPVIAGLADYYYLLSDIDDGTDTATKREDAVKTFDETVGVKALDNLTVEYTLSQPTPYFLGYAITELMLPVEWDFITEKGEDYGTTKESMLYNGAYYMSAWERDKNIVFTKNENYWDKDKVTLKAIDFQTVGDSVSKLELFQRGEVYDAGSISSEDLLGLQNTDWGKYIFLSDKGVGSYWYTFNFESKNTEFKAAVQNENFRKALKAAINPETLSAIWEPNDPSFFTRYTLLPESAMYDTDGKDYTDYPALAPYKGKSYYNPTEAKKYIDAAIAEITDGSGNIKDAEAGKVDMLPITEFTTDGKLPIDILYTSSSSAEEMKKSLLIKEMLETALGKENVNVVLGYSNVSFSDEVWSLANWDLVDDSYGFRYADPSANLNRITTDGALNDSQWNIPEYDAMIDKARAIYSINERYAAYSEAEAWMLEHVYIIPYLTTGGSYLMTKLVPFTQPGGKFGMPQYKYKGALVQETPVTAEQYKELTEQHAKEVAELGK